MISDDEIEFLSSGRHARHPERGQCERKNDGVHHIPGLDLHGDMKDFGSPDASPLSYY
jgi:hypothetical protein